MITDHVAILLMGALAQPMPSKAKPGKIEYYAQFAFPAEATADLLDACKSVAPNGDLSGLQLAPKIHSTLPAAKQFAGIPADWVIVRMSSGPDYPPELFLQTGQKVAAEPINSAAIRADFFSGQRVRVNTYPFAYKATNGGAPGVSFNLSGVMAVGGGERRGGAGGEPSESAFAKYRAADAPPEVAPVAQSAPAQTPTAGAPTAAANPFAQGTAAQPSNPFGAR